MVTATRRALGAPTKPGCTICFRASGRRTVSRGPWAPALDGALSRLDQLVPIAKEQLVEAMVATVTHDQQLTMGEAELLRAVCASMHCPLPPLVAS